MDKPTEQSLWGILNELTDDLKNQRLADVFRFVSFESFERYNKHEHRRIEINYVKKGSCLIHLENESLSFKQDELMIICPHVEHEFEAGATGCCLMQLEFLPEVFCRFSNEESGNNELTPFNLFSPENRMIKIVNNVRIMRAVQRIVSELSTKSKYYQHIVLMYYVELLILIFRYVDEACLLIGSNEVLKKAITFVRSNYDKDICVKDISETVGVSERYLRKLFARYVDMSPLDYLNRIRINRSIELLRITEMSIKEISFKCGFQSPQYFSRVFKSQLGMTPREFLDNKNK